MGAKKDRLRFADLRVLHHVLRATNNPHMKSSTRKAAASSIADRGLLRADGATLTKCLGETHRRGKRRRPKVPDRVIASDQPIGCILIQRHQQL